MKTVGYIIMNSRQSSIVVHLRLMVIKTGFCPVNGNLASCVEIFTLEAWANLMMRTIGVQMVEWVPGVGIAVMMELRFTM